MAYKSLWVGVHDIWKKSFQLWTTKRFLGNIHVLVHTLKKNTVWGAEVRNHFGRSYCTVEGQHALNTCYLPRYAAKKWSGSLPLKHRLGWGWACWSSETSAGGCSDRFVSCSSGTTPDERSGHVSAHPRHRHANVGAAAMISVTVMNQSLASQASQGRHNTEGCRV